MNCPYCLNQETSVLESRTLPGSEGIRRRRRCVKCGKRFTTHERVVSLDLKVIKKDGRLEDFDREKLIKGVRKSCYKRAVPDTILEALVDDIEIRLLRRKATKIKSSDIGQMVLSRLKRVDNLAYLRFASVYMDFATADDFGNFVNQKLAKTNQSE